MSFGRKIEFAAEQEPLSPEKKSLGRPIDLEKGQISRLRSLINAFPKGLIKGASSFSPLPNLGPVPQKLGESLTEQFLPTQDRFAENALERAGKLTPAALGGGKFGAGLARAGLGALAGEITKEAGGGETAQTVAELGAFGAPSLGRKIVPTKAQKKLVDFARRAGMKEEQIAPLLPEKGKKAFFGKFASKTGKTQEALAKSREGVSEAYNFVKDSPLAMDRLSTPAAENFMRESAKIAEEMPFQIRSQLSQDAKDLLKTGLTGKGLINFYQDISSKYKIGREQLERLKGPVLEALESISPELKEDFTLANELYKKRLGIGKTLKPGLSSELMDLGELGKLAHSMMKFSMKGLAESVGIGAARRIAREMLINPRLQNIAKQMEKAAIQNKFPIVINLAKYIKDKFAKEEESVP